MKYTFEEIGTVRSPLKEKFGAPKQSQLAEDYICTIEMKREFSNPHMFRSLEGFSHLWIIWVFSKVEKGKYSPTVRPPRLCGNKRVGVFASRSPFRPNPIAMTVVKLISVERSEDGLMLIKVSGGDFIDDTPILDIKPYIHYDSIPLCTSGFAEGDTPKLKVKIPDGIVHEIKSYLGDELLLQLIQLLENNPRPAYHSDGKSYTMSFADYQIEFKISEDVLTIISFYES